MTNLILIGAPNIGIMMVSRILSNHNIPVIAMHNLDNKPLLVDAVNEFFPSDLTNPVFEINSHDFMDYNIDTLNLDNPKCKNKRPYLKHYIPTPNLYLLKPKANQKGLEFRTHDVKTPSLAPLSPALPQHKLYIAIILLLYRFKNKKASV